MFAYVQRALFLQGLGGRVVFDVKAPLNSGSYEAAVELVGYHAHCHSQVDFDVRVDGIAGSKRQFAHHHVHTNRLCVEKGIALLKLLLHLFADAYHTGRGTYRQIRPSMRASGANVLWRYLPFALVVKPE